MAGLTARQAPHFAATLARRATRYYVRVGGRYSDNPMLHGVRVSHYHFSSADPAMRRRELQALHAAFARWWRIQWAHAGGDGECGSRMLGDEAVVVPEPQARSSYRFMGEIP